MTVYVDDMRAPFGGMLMCHLIADTRLELLLMADRIGVNRKWIQHGGTAQEHFDIALTKRKLAVEKGAREITWKQCALMCSNRARTGQLGDPALAEQLWRELNAGGDPAGPWADAEVAKAAPIGGGKIAPRCQCGVYATFYEGDHAWCRACLPAGWLAATGKKVQSVIPAPRPAGPAKPKTTLF